MRWSKVGQPRGFFVRAVLNSIQGRFARPLLLLLLLETISNFATIKIHSDRWRERKGYGDMVSLRKQNAIFSPFLLSKCKRGHCMCGFERIMVA